MTELLAYSFFFSSLFVGVSYLYGAFIEKDEGVGLFAYLIAAPIAVISGAAYLVVSLIGDIL
jgi:hypothetical protein